MKKKLFVTAILLAIFSFAFVSFTFAANGMDEAVNGVRNFVGGAENVVEDAGKGAVTGIRDGLNTIGNGAKDVTKDAENGMNDNMGRNNGDNGYDATRTATGIEPRGGTTDGGGFFANISGNVWTWVILAIAAIVIVALVMYYAKQGNVTTYNHNDNDE